MDLVPEEGLSSGAYGGSGPRRADLEVPPAHAHDGRGRSIALPASAPPSEEDDAILEAIGGETEWMMDFLADLVRAPSVLGNEEAGQEVARRAIGEVGLAPIDVPMDADVLRRHPAHSPFDWDVSGKSNVVATWPSSGRGRSLILNGHVDVVSPEPRSRWSRDPFGAEIHDGWLYGRGAADMKCGVASIFGAAKGLRAMGFAPDGPIHIESVVEEECTGNGSLACLLAGYTADAAVIAEPFGAAITTSQVGVLWFQVRVTGVTEHAAETPTEANAIERSFAVLRALRTLEADLNADPPPPYDRFAHPINMNVGAIRGGDWASTSPGECVTHYRIALYPGMKVRALQERIEAAVARATVEHSATLDPPKVEYTGFACEGYEIWEESPLVTTLARSFARRNGAPPALVATTGTTDARVFGLHFGIPAVCFGPSAEQAHAVDERVYLHSVVQTAQVLGLFIKDWCGLSSES
jgi:acetylornithine deacetylase